MGGEKASEIQDVVTPAQVLRRPQDFLETKIAVRGFLVTLVGEVISEKPLVIEFPAALLQLDVPPAAMYRRVLDEDYIPSAILLINQAGFGEAVMHGYEPGWFNCPIGYDYLFRAPAVVLSKLRMSDNPDPEIDYELFDPELVTIESAEHFGKIISFDCGTT